MSELQIVLSTSPAEAAPRLARMLVERRLAACVNILPQLRSIYRWQERIMDEPESLLLIKTSATQQAELFRVLADEHPYDVPEILSLPCAAALPTYLEWVLAETRDSDAP